MPGSEGRSPITSRAEGAWAVKERLIDVSTAEAAASKTTEAPHRHRHRSAPVRAEEEDWGR
jgi:hypothetical protein